MQITNDWFFIITDGVSELINTEQRCNLSLQISIIIKTPDDLKDQINER